jgi:hypothetical protein
MELDFTPDYVTWVGANKEVEVNPGQWELEYNGFMDSVFIPCGDTAWIDFQLHQTPKSRVLLYYGNGGWDDGTNFDELKEMYEDFGYIVDYTDEWPDEFDWTLKYELIILLGPGHDTWVWDPVTSTGPEDLIVDGFTIGQKADLDAYLQQHGKLVILCDASSFTGDDVENDLLLWLPVEMQFGDNDDDTPPSVQGDWTSGHGDQVTADCLTGNVATYSALDAADNWTDVRADPVTGDPGHLILQNPGSGQCPLCPMYAADIPSHGNGLVAILGDLHGLTDGAHMAEPYNWSADNEWVAINWLTCPAP